VLTRARVAALGYVYVVLGVAALAVGGDHPRAATAVFTVAAFAYLWFLASLRALLVRFDPDGFFAGVVILGGASFLALQAAGLAAHIALGCRGYSRTDFIAAGDDEIYFLELNTLPGLTAASLVPQQLRAAGIDFRDFLERQVELAAR